MGKRSSAPAAAGTGTGLAPARWGRLSLLGGLLAVLAAVWCVGPVRSEWLRRQSVAALAAYVAEHPADAEAALPLARRYLALREPAQAEAVLTGVTEKDPANGDAWLLRSEAEMAQRQLGAAYASLKVAMPFLERSADAHWRLGVLLERKGEEEAALAEFRRAVQLDPGHPEANTELARQELSRLFYQPAVQHLTAARRRRWRDPVLLELLASAHRSLGDLDHAEQEARAALRLDPGRASTWETLGQVLASRATEPSLPEAEAAYRKAVELDPGAPQLHQELGQLYFRRGEYRRAGDELRTALKIHPLLRAAYPALIQCCLRLGEKREAERLTASYRAIDEMDLSTAPLEYTVDAMPGNTTARLKLARLYLRYHRPDLASAQLDRILELNPDQVEALRLRGRLPARREP